MTKKFTVDVTTTIIRSRTFEVIAETVDEAYDVVSEAGWANEDVDSPSKCTFDETEVDNVEIEDFDDDDGEEINDNESVSAVVASLIGSLQIATGDQLDFREELIVVLDKYSLSIDEDTADIEFTELDEDECCK